MNFIWVAIVQVDDTVAGLNRLAGAYRGELRAKVIAVGGSNGKTTAKRILHTILAEKFNGHASPKSFNNNIGMPLTILEVESGHEFVVLEIGTNAPGEIAALGAVCRPDIAVITSIGLEHLEKLGDLEGVAREEASIAAFLKTGGTLVLPAEAPELMTALKMVGGQRILVGTEKPGAGSQKPIAADLVGTDIRESMAGVSFSLNGRGRYELPLLGEHNVLNALLAMAVARRMGVSDEQIVRGLAKVKPAEGRLEPMTVGSHPLIHDAYNANPSSMEAALKTFGRIEGSGRKVAVLGDMLELGETSELMHRSVGAMVVGFKMDVLVAIGPMMQHAAAVAAAAGGVEVQRFASTAEARLGIANVIKDGDAILLKGSHGMALETLLGVLGRMDATPALAH